MTFYFDENLVYHRGLLIYVLYAASFFYLVCGVAYLIRYKKMVTNDKFVALMLMYPLNVLAVLIQLFLLQYLVEMFMTSLTMLLVVLVILYCLHDGYEKGLFHPKVGSDRICKDHKLSCTFIDPGI